MEQLILHLLGDYVFQTHWMAREKVKSWYAASVHALVYSCPFILLTSSFTAIMTILVTHCVIDRFSLAKYVLFAKNWITDQNLTFKMCSKTGYPDIEDPEDPQSDGVLPMWLTFWLYAVADNTIHLCINYAAIRWL